MFFIILGIIVIIILVTIFVSPYKENNNSTIDWWTIGMIADLHNKSQKKNKK